MRVEARKKVAKSLPISEQAPGFTFWWNDHLWMVIKSSDNCIVKATDGCVPAWNFSGDRPGAFTDDFTGYVPANVKVVDND